MAQWFGGIIECLYNWKGKRFQVYIYSVYWNLIIVKLDVIFIKM